MRVERRLSRAVSSANRAARQRGLPATLTVAQWTQTVSDFEGRCAYCMELPYTALEHYLPLAWKGGTTVDNCVPACASCNARKNYMHPQSMRDNVCSWQASANRVYAYLLMRKEEEDAKNK